MVKYRIQIVRGSVGGYVASCDSLPGCVSHGDNREETRERMEEAIRGYYASFNETAPANLHRCIVEKR